MTCSARIRARSAVGQGLSLEPVHGQREREREGGSESGVSRRARKSRVEGWPSQQPALSLLLDQTSVADFRVRALHTHSQISPRLAHATVKMADDPRKRSRFDQAEPDPPRRSKFDRRSRSPSKGDGEAATRSRSPVAKSVEGSGPRKDAAAAAAEAAARINAQLSQKKAPQHVDVPPIRAVSGRLERPELHEQILNALSCRPTLPALLQAPPSPPPLPPTVARSMSRSTSKTVTTSRTSRSMTYATATP